jgi:hypothetical protein
MNTERTQLRRYTFTVVLSGIGTSPEIAWEDAIKQFAMDNGEPDCTEEQSDDDAKEEFGYDTTAL